MRRDSREYLAADMGWVAEWDFDPILAIGGCKHGELLPKSTSTFGDLMVMKPPDLSVYLITDPAPTTMMDDQVERYRTHRFIMSSRRELAAEVFPVYVEATMPLDEAQDWLLLLVICVIVLVRLARLGLLDYLAAHRKLERDMAQFEDWATLMRRLHQLRDELGEL